MALKSIIIFTVYKKGSKSNFLEQNTIFLVNVARFARKHFLVYPILVGTFCRSPKLPSSSQIPEVWPNKAHPALHPVSPPRVHLTPASMGETQIKLKTKSKKILMFIVQGEIADWMVENRTFFELWPLKPGKNCPPRGPLAAPRKQRELWMVHSVGFYHKYSHFCPTFRDEIDESLYSLLLNNHQGKNFHWSFKKIREMTMTRWQIPLVNA